MNQRTDCSTSVVIVSYQPGDWLTASVRSVSDQCDEVIVVDNGSSDGIVSAMAEPAGATVVRSPRNLGFAGGANLGVSTSRGRVVALLNDDATAPAEWLTTAVNVLQDESIAAVGPKVVLAGRFREIVLADQAWQAPGDVRQLGRQLRSVQVGGEEVLGRLVGPGVHKLEVQGEDRWRWTAGPLPFYAPIGQTVPEVTVNGEPAPPGPLCQVLNSAGTYLRMDGYAGDTGFGSPDDGRWNTGADRFGVSFAAVAFRRATWDRLGGLADRYFAYYEDVDWCWRAQLAGFRVCYDPTVSVSHRCGATSGGVTGPNVRLLSESNRSLTIVRNAPRRSAAKHLAERGREGHNLWRHRDDGVTARVVRHLPWALSTRLANRRRTWTSSAEEVWSRWADRDVEWSLSPVGTT